jgi:D-glycerate 3-kinase
LLPEVLAAPPHNLRLAALSLDDLYLPHAELTKLAKDNPENKLLHGRGQPGTHDVPLGHHCLEALAGINKSRGSVDLPVYDKSQFSGKGDRSSEVVKVEAPVDIVIFEGWATGFYSITEEKLRQMYDKARADPQPFAQERYGYEDPFFLSHDVKSLLQVNDKLKEYEEKMWKYIDCFIQLRPRSMSYVWKWRLEVGKCHPSHF